jgi:hypothetical protein
MAQTSILSFVTSIPTTPTARTPIDTEMSEPTDTHTRTLAPQNLRHAMEEDIGDEEERSEIESPRASDDGFIDDTDNQDYSGLEQRQLDAMQVDEMRTRYEYAAEDEADDAGGEKEKELKTRVEARKLFPSTERGLGTVYREIGSDYDTVAPFRFDWGNLTVRPWHLQPGRRTGSEIPKDGHLAHGAFGDDGMKNLLNNSQLLNQYAELFFFPFNEKVPMRALSTDIETSELPATVMDENFTGKLLHFLDTTHDPMELSKIGQTSGTLSESIVDVFFGTQTMNGLLNRNIMDGSYGGDEGKAGCVLWMVDWSRSGMIPTELLTLAQLLCEYLKGTSGDENCSGVQSQWTEFTHSGKKGLSKCQTEVRTSRFYNYSQAGQQKEKYTSDDLDSELLKKLTCFRLEKGRRDVDWSDKQMLNSSRIIQERRQVSDPDQIGTPLEMYLQPEDNWSASMFGLWLFQDIIRGVEAETKSIKHIGVYGLYIKATTTGNDPLVVLDNLAQNRTDMHVALYKVLAHMQTRLGKNVHLSRQQMFGSDRAAASEMCTDYMMMEALFKFAHERNIRNVNFGGMRYDPTNKEEQRVWRSVNRHAHNAMRRHYLKIKHTIMENRAKSARQAALPDLTYKNEYYPGISYVAFDDDEMRQRMAIFLEDSQFEDYRNKQEELYRWYGRLHCTDRRVHMIHGEARPYNNGIWIQLQCEGKISEEEKQKKDKEFREVVQPLMLVNAIACWTHFKHQDSDQLAVFFTDKTLVPDISWLRTEMNKPFSKLPPVVNKLLLFVGQFLSDIDSQTLDEVDPVKMELLQLVGKRPHAMQAELKFLYAECHDLATLSRRTHQLILSHKDFTLGTMKRCRLKHYQVAAASIYDLQRIRKQDQEAWVADYRPMQMRLAQKYDANTHLLNCYHNVAIFLSLTEERLRTELNFCNKYLLMDLILNTIYQLRNEQGSYGGCTRMQDGGGGFKVLKLPDGKHQAATAPAVVDYKSPTAGADVTMALLAALFNVHLVHNAASEEVRQLHKFIYDVSMRHSTALNLAKLGGSAVQLEKGQLDKRDCKYEAEVGCNYVQTELNKMGEGPEHIGKIEAFLAHSGNGYYEGGGTALRQENWGSSYNFTNVSVEQIRNGIPLIFITGNRPCLGSGSSLCESGRITVKASSTQDASGRILVQKNVNIMNAPYVELGGQNAEKTSEDYKQKMTKMWKNWACVDMLNNGDARKDIRMPDSDKARGNRLYFLWMRWLRGDVSLLLCALSHRVAYYAYTFRASLTHMENVLEELARNMRRRTFPDKDTWHRNASGPLRSVVINGQHIQQISMTALLYAQRKAQDGHDLDLFEAHQRAIIALHIQPVSTYTLISGVHHWLAEFVMDHSIMVLSAYMLSTSGFQHYCPLHVISLVLRGHYSSLKRNSQKQYLALCGWLQPLVCGGMVPQNGPWPVAQGLVQTPSKEQLGEWMTYKSSTCQNSIAMQYHHRTGQGPSGQLMPNAQPSGYFCNANRIIHSEHVRGVGLNDQGKATVGDNNVTGTANLILGEMFGRQQMRHAERQKENPYMKGYQDTTAFWNAAKTGTRLPFPNKENNDQYKLNFDPVQETGFFYSEIMNTANENSTPLRLFLMQSGMDADVSMYEFLDKLMQPYFQSLPNGAGQQMSVWQGFQTQKVLEDAKMFAWKSCPYMNPHTCMPEGVEVNLCMRIVHGIFFQGLMCKDWTTKRNAGLDFKATVHLRNTSQITQELMSLVVHNAFEPAMIPANAGKLYMPAPAPYDEILKPAAIRVDSRLYVDQKLVQPDMLSCVSRVFNFTNNSTQAWTIHEMSETKNTHLMFCSFMEECKELQNISDCAQIFPFPPESVAHIQHMTSLYLAVNKLYNNNNCKRRSKRVLDCNDFLLAMMEFCVDAKSEHQEAYQVCLTEFVTRLVDNESMEIPCVSFSNHLFVLQVRRDEDDIVKVYVKPVNQTHQINEALAINRAFNIDQTPFVCLPLDQDVVSFECNQLNEFLSRGLHQVGENMIVDFAPRQEPAIASYLFPLVAYPCLIALCAYGFLLELQMREENGVKELSDAFDDGIETDARLFPAELLFLTETSTTCNATCSLDDLRKNPAVDNAVVKALGALPCLYKLYVCVPNLVDADQAATIHLNFDPALQPFFWLVLEQPSKKRSRQLASDNSYYRFQSIGHLTFDAMHNRLVPKSSELWKHLDYHWYAGIDFDGQTYYSLVKESSSESIAADFSTYRSSNQASKLICNSFATMTATADLKQSTEIMLMHSECTDLQLPNYFFKWGISTTHPDSHHFLEQGHHHVSYMSMDKSAQSLFVDFAVFSRSMRPEGSELWLNLDSELYRCVVDKLKEQHASVSLPVPKHQHEQLYTREGDSPQWLRTHYMLGSTAADTQVHQATVAVVVAVANKSVITRAMANKNRCTDANSLTNTELMSTQYHLYKIVVPIILNDKHTFALSVPNSESFHKYLMHV